MPSIVITRFSAIARSVMISADLLNDTLLSGESSFSAIARSVMISAAKGSRSGNFDWVSVL